jgi:hypothetical protein
VAVETRIKFTHGQFGVYQHDADGRQSILATFSTLAAAQEAYPGATPDPNMTSAAAASQNVPSTRKAVVAAWIAGATLGLAGVIDLAAVGSFSSPPIGNPCDGTPGSVLLLSVIVLAAGSIVALVVRRGSAGPARRLALTLGVIGLLLVPLLLVAGLYVLGSEIFACTG